MGIIASGRIYEGGGTRGGEYIRPTIPEHHFTVYCDSSDTVSMSGGGTSAGSRDAMAVAESGRYKPMPRVREDGGAGDGGREGGRHRDGGSGVEGRGG